MNNMLIMSNIFKESCVINEYINTATRKIELIDKSSKMKLNIEIEDNDKIEQLYRIIVDAPSDKLEQFIKDNKEIDLNTNIDKFSKKQDSFMTPLAVAVWVSYVTNEMIDNVLYLISNGAKTSGYISDYVEELEHTRIIDEINDWDEWDTIRDIFNVEKEMTDKERKQSEKDTYWDTKIHQQRDEK